MEMVSPLIDKIKINKKLLMTIVSLVAGMLLSFGAGLRVLKHFDFTSADVFDAIITGLIISGGTEGFNSIMKFADYAKEKKKSEVNKA
jgi:hypothetical protein